MVFKELGGEGLQALQQTGGVPHAVLNGYEHRKA
jgi:hypothetical protein